MRRRVAIMNSIKRMLAAGVIFAVVSVGAFADEQRKDDRKVPDKEKTVKVPVTPKNQNGNSGQGGNKNDKKGRP
jgi:hypothetical protein